MTEVEVSLTGRESEFELEEIIYSMTDQTSLIVDFNSVFQRVSKYETHELLHKQHSVVRNPKMPRGVFRLMWDTILSNKRFAGYVVNRAKNGDHYWVFACVVPVEDKFISFRTKPVFRELFTKIEQIYLRVLEKERELQKPIDQASLGLEELLKYVKGIGFETYDEFWKWVFLNEFVERVRKFDLEKARVLLKDSKRARELEYLYNTYLEFTLPLSRLVNAREKSFNLKGMAKALKQVSLNLSIRSKKIGDSGATLDCISTEIRRFSDYVDYHVETLDRSINQLLSKFFDFTSWLLFALLPKEANLWRDNTRDCELVTKTDISKSVLSRLNELVRFELERYFEDGIHLRTDELKSFADRFLRFEKNLNFITVSGKAESSRLEDSDSFWALLGQVEEQAKLFNQMAFELSQLTVAMSQLIFAVSSSVSDEYQNGANNYLQ
ncbi:MAG: PAS domain-containing protein [Deltaproteobacteria bacterium]|nr:PAS domain-containing protein [Deltaproteobacteria bacterium]